MFRRHLFPVVAALFLVLAGGSSAFAEEQPTVPPPPATMDHGTHNTAAPAPPADHSGHAADKAGEAAQPPAGHDMAAMHKQHEAIMAHVATLRTEMTAIKATTDVQERKQLMQAHLTSMTKALNMLNGLGCGAMMQSGKCPMMQNMQHGQGHGDKQGHAGSAMPHGGMDMGHMAMCQQMMQQKAELTNSLLEQLIEMQGQLLEGGK